MSFNKALLVAAFLISIVAYFQMNMNTKETITNDLSTEILFTKAEYKLFNSEPKKKIPRKILVPIQDGDQMINVNEILYCVAANNRVQIHTETTHQPIETTTKFSLTKMKNKIGSADFLYHELRKYIINFNSIDKIIRIPQANQKHYKYKIIMESNDTLPLPVDKKDGFMNVLYDYIDNY